MRSTEGQLQIKTLPRRLRQLVVSVATSLRCSSIPEPNLTAVTFEGRFQIDNNNGSVKRAKKTRGKDRLRESRTANRAAEYQPYVLSATAIVVVVSVAPARTIAAAEARFNLRQPRATSP